jgi:HAD superfamily hydrolase (TIGR01509 family)
MNRLHALIFDVDGTLAETERDGHRPAFNAAFTEAGLDWHWDEALYGDLLDITGGKERISHFAARHAPDIAGDPDFTVLVRELHLAKTAHYLRLVDQGCLPLRPGIARLIDEARQAGIRLAIATTTSPANVAALLTASLGPQAASWFEVIGAGDVVPAKKPAPDIYCWVLDRLGLPAAACLAVEDSLPGDDQRIHRGPGFYGRRRGGERSWESVIGGPRGDPWPDSHPGGAPAVSKDACFGAAGRPRHPLS